MKGTARPTRYVALLDENQLSVDDLQRLVNGQCWQYARATKAVGLASPAYYADQICERAKLHMTVGEDGTPYLPPVHEDLKSRMVSYQVSGLLPFCMLTFHSTVLAVITGPASQLAL